MYDGRMYRWMVGTLNVLYEKNGQRCTCKVRHSKKYTNIFTIHKYIKIYIYECVSLYIKQTIFYSIVWIIVSL